MDENGQTKTAVRGENGSTLLTPADVKRLFEDGYREVEVLADGSVRERVSHGDGVDEAVTRTLKTQRTWY